MIRRCAPLKSSAGTRWPPDVAAEIRARDGRCVGERAGFAGACAGAAEIDHVRASHAIGMKSPSTADNGVLVCGEHHRWKTEHGREARPLLLAYLARVTA